MIRVLFVLLDIAMPVKYANILISFTSLSRVTHIWVSKLTTIGSDNGLSPDRRQAIIWTNAGILLIGPLGTKFSDVAIETLTFSFKKMRLKVSSAKWRPFRLGLNVSIYRGKTPSLQCYNCLCDWCHITPFYPSFYTWIPNFVQAVIHIFKCIANDKEEITVLLPM